MANDKITKLQNAFKTGGEDLAAFMENMRGYINSDSESDQHLKDDDTNDEKHNENEENDVENGENNEKLQKKETPKMDESDYNDPQVVEFHNRENIE
jgi:Sec-independent protein translocase protein TatA